MTDAAHYDYVVVGGGSAGCVLASRLTEDRTVRVLLIEAGHDIAPGREPAEVLSPRPAVIFHGKRYLWPRLKVTPFAHRPGYERFYEQARVLGGGSTVNAQVGNRGVPDDYDQWAEKGALGWDWASVLPYFRKLEADADFDGPMHGNAGPMPISRVTPAKWPKFSQRLATALDDTGFRDIGDQNAVFTDGYFAAAYTNAGGQRVTASMAYLPASVRQRGNLAIHTDAFALELEMDGVRARGVRYLHKGSIRTVEAGEVILSLGALHSPAMLMRAGIGPQDALDAVGIEPRVIREGVGRNLRDHPGTHICAWVRPDARLPADMVKPGHLALRFSSTHPEGAPSDLYMHSGVSSAWHGVGRRVAYFYFWLNKSTATGRVRLASTDPGDHPLVDMNLLGTKADVERLAEAFRQVAVVVAGKTMADVLDHPFALRFSPLIRTMSQVNRFNAMVMEVLGRLLDGPQWLRRILLRHVVSNAPRLDDLASDPERLERYLRDNAMSVSHVSCTCRIGAPDDPLAVTDPRGRVIGTHGLRVVDASVMPTLPRANTNLAVLMIAEKMADAILADRSSS